jgi:hypothetical protein
LGYGAEDRGMAGNPKFKEQNVKLSEFGSCGQIKIQNWRIEKAGIE